MLGCRHVRAAGRRSFALLLLRDAMHVLMESTPRGPLLPAVRDRILAVPGVVGVHDLHEVDTCLGEDVDLGHRTIQVEHVSRPMESEAHE
jgi:Co/Zn/Cd efflux system component